MESAKICPTEEIMYSHTSMYFLRIDSYIQFFRNVPFAPMVDMEKVELIRLAQVMSANQIIRLDRGPPGWVLDPDFP